tara:strand:+ start:65789 stop:67351 length:1563 start_codon:yes stop_codon:yes gene_type:complete
MINFEDFIQSNKIEGFSSKKIFNGESFDDIFLIDNIPLFWFYKRYMLNHVLPKPINTYQDLLNKRKISFVKKAKTNLLSSCMAKYLFYREKKKIDKYTKKSAAKNGADVNTPKALLLTYASHILEGNKFYRIQSIIDVLQKDAIIEPFPLVVNQISSNVTIPSDLTNIYQYCHLDIIEESKARAKGIADKWKNLNLSGKPPIYFEGVDLSSYLYPAISFFMSKEFLFTIVVYYEIFKRIIKDKNIKVVFITGQNGIFERCLAAAAWHEKMPCMLVPHGFAIGNTPSQDILENIHVPVFNSTTAAQFIEAGVSKDQIKVTGPSCYDDIVKYKVGNSNDKNILLTTQPLIEDNFMTEDGYFNMVEYILKELLVIPDIRIIIKLHPREKDVKKYEEIAEKLGRNRITIKQKGKLNLLYELMIKSKLVINFYSTACVLEASILDIPSITYPYDGKRNFKYGEFDPSIYVKDGNSLREAVNKILENPEILKEKRSQMVKEYCTIVDGKSSQRIVNWAYDLTNMEK